MKLVRLATIYLVPPPVEFKPLSVSYPGGSIVVLAHGSSDNEYFLLVSAEVALTHPPTVNEIGQIFIPEEPRKVAETEIEYFANLTAVREGSSRQLRSPALCIAFIPESDDDHQLLAKARTYRGQSPSIIGVKPYLDLTPDQINKFLNDREDGLALLAEALAHQHAMGQFHELLRVFERAFTLGPSELIDPLSEFLSGAKGGFTKNEVNDWLGRLRGPSTHADKRPNFFLESDVRPVIWRMRQAAYDVLLNKKSWRDKSPERRVAWVPPAWTPAPQGDTIVAREGGIFQGQLQWLDNFGVFHFDMKAEVRKAIPLEWWVEPPDVPQEST